MRPSSILQELYYSNILPYERGRVPNEKYAMLMRKIDEIETQIRDTLSSEKREKFEELIELRAQSDNMEEVGLFRYAFCMGALIVDKKSRAVMRLISFFEAALSYRL